MLRSIVVYFWGNMNSFFMYQKNHNRAEIAVKKIVERIILSGEISREDHSALTYTVLIDGEVSDSDRRQINRIFDYIQTGRLQLVD